MSGLTGNISPCAACATTGEQMSAILTMLLRQYGDVVATQLQVAVNGNNVAVLPATDTSRRVFLQNADTHHMFIKFGAGAVNTGAAGEWILNKAGGGSHGDGGVFEVPAGYKGVITAASTSATKLNVVVFE